jgi:DNA polymerase III alpha subunit (gram-positive type)
VKAVFLHVHTTGLDHAVDEVVEFAMLPWNDGKAGEVITEKFFALGEVPAEAAKINGYEHEARRSCASFRHGYVAGILKTIAEHDGVIIANNPEFSWSFIRTAAVRLRVPMPAQRIRTIDTASLATPLYLAGKVQGLSTRDLAVLTGRPYTCASSRDTVIMLKDIFESEVRAYLKAL